ncbi:MAG: lysophospholipid acyltransferase family protein [Gemmatimonadota bacterium]|nr:lysophospholipid acyltransferase family protein [Gemmatimonadota bacterium]
MILYRLLRLTAGIALRWFYRDVRERHADRVPPGATPLLLVVNHPNALVDALLVGWAMPRPVTITAKATLFENAALARFLRYMGVVPLRRASDERRPRAAAADPADAAGRVRRVDRNTEAFRAILRRLEEGGAVLIFPEGKSHDEPALAPLRTGPARIALQAQREGRVRALAILPIGLIFERKEAPRSRVLVDVGDPLDVGGWVSAAARRADGASEVDALTEEIDRRLRDVTLNYATADEAARTRGLARVFASLLDDPPPVGTGRSLEDEVELERRLAQARRLLEGERADPALRARAERFLDRLDTFEHALRAEGIAVDDVAISLRRRHGARFALREGAVLALAGPVALWGRLNHWLPFRLARALGQRDMTSRDQPAMRTILAGFVLVLLFYGLATTLVARLAGGVAAAAYLVSLPIAADIDLRFAERMRRARQRMRAYLRFRRDPQLRERLCAEHAWLTSEIGELARAFERAG